jgi:hypothetical protein
VRHALTVHRDTPSASTPTPEVYVSRGKSNTLLLHYYVNGIQEIVIPQHVGWIRSDELWRHTCFEAFLRIAGDSAYYEFNFSPSMQWAIYHFDDHRAGMRVADEIEMPHIEGRHDTESLELRVHLKLNEVPDLRIGTWQLGLSAVIEEKNAHKSYWALRHPQGRPDFHHSDGFALEIPAASGA